MVDPRGFNPYLLAASHHGMSGVLTREDAGRRRAVIAEVKRM